MTIRYKCEDCGSSLKIKDELAGTAGKCPKCKKKFTIPEPGDSDDSADVGKPEISEEDAIFGKGFFELKEPTSTRPKFTMPTFDDDDDDDDDLPADRPRTDSPVDRPRSVAPVAAVRAQMTENAASIAGSLLGTTGKKNAREDVVEDEGPQYDFSAITYLITRRILPIVVGGTILTYGLFHLFSGMMSDARKLPKLAEVTGTVMLDGKPVYAELTFNPAADPLEQVSEDVVKGSNSIAWTNEGDGTFTAMYTNEIVGAVLGRHMVTISLPRNGISDQREIEVKERDNPPLKFELKSPQAVPVGP